MHFNKYSIHLLLLILIVFSGNDLGAQQDTVRVQMDPIQADRPDQTESASLTPKGYFQMEHGFLIEDTEPGYVYVYPTSLWKAGITENFEIRLITEFVRVQSPDEADVEGFLPIQVGFKSRLTEQKGIWPKISFLGHVGLPGIVREDFETTYLAPNFRFLCQHAVSDFFGFGYNIGLEWDGENAEPEVNYTLAAGFALTRRLGIFLEGYGSTPQRESGPIEIRADAGLTYLIGNDFLLDVSAGQGISEGADERFISMGFSYRFKL